jgi:cyanate permease
VQAAYAVVGAILLTLGLRTPGRTVEAPTGTATGTASLRAVWADPVLRATTQLVVVGFGVFVGLTTWLQALLEPHGISSDTAGVLLIAMVLAGVVGSVVLPPIATRRGAERSVLLASLVVTAAGAALLAVVHAPIGIGIVLAAMGLLLLATLPVVLEVTERRAGPASGTAAALLWMAGNAGGLVVTVVLAPLLKHPAAGFLVLAAVALAGLPILGRLSDDDLRRVG